MNAAASAAGFSLAPCARIFSASGSSPFSRATRRAGLATRAIRRVEILELGLALGAAQLRLELGVSLPCSATDARIAARRVSSSTM